MMRSSFISLYQELVQQTEDKLCSNNVLLGSQTRTDAREQADQDPLIAGTQTSTRTRENPDSDNSCYGHFSIIP